MFFKKTPTISTTELENKLSEKPQIIDVREPHEFKIGHIPGAKSFYLYPEGSSLLSVPIWDAQ